jgi:hypothetical protein
MQSRIPFLVLALTLLIRSRSMAQSAQPPVVSDLLLQNNFLHETVMGTVTAINDPTSWSDLTFLSYTPGFGALPSAPGKHFDPIWDTTTQKFSWNTFASSDGT